MTAGTTKPTVRRERRIIERPRLIKLLDESEARIILLLAPAGYGKTTLARQWAKTLNGAIWVSLTPAHRDVVRFSDDLIQGVEQLGASTSFVREYLGAQSNPQNAAFDIARRLTQGMNEAESQWLALDDWHEVCGADEIETMFEAFAEGLRARILITSRVRPRWIKARQVIYGEVMEIGSSDLAMTDEEATQVLGRGSDLNDVAKRAGGWPAVLGLAAAAAETAAQFKEIVPSAIHRYLAEELFQSAPNALRFDLLSLALLPDLNPDTLRSAFAMRAHDVVDAAQDRGFVSGDVELHLHPLLREFLFLKLRDEPDANERVRRAIDASVVAHKWQHALELVAQFALVDLIDTVLGEAMLPLLRSGHLGTLASFASQMRAGPAFPPASLDLLDAELSFREGQFELASELAERALSGLGADNRLRSRAHTLIGHSRYLLAAHDEAERAFTLAQAAPCDDIDNAEAIHGLVLTRVFGERDGVEPVMEALARLRRESPVHLLRHATAELTRRRFQEGLRGSLGLEEALHTLPNVRDPRARSSFTYSVAYSLGIRADYDEAVTYLRMLFEDVESFDLNFARPYAEWTRGMISLGLRKFGEAERAIQAVEDEAKRPHQYRHAVNARALRARLLLQLGQTKEALREVQPEITEPQIPSWHGEYLATKALALACAGDRKSIEVAAESMSVSRSPEVRLLATTAIAAANATAGRPQPTRRLMQLASQLGTWDPVVCGARSSPALAEALTSDEIYRAELADLYQRSRDRGLARKAGLRTRASRAPHELLSPRELEVLGLIARGFRNREISEALFIADSTTKIHVRHIFEKLGVRNRAEAVARYEMFTEAR